MGTASRQIAPIPTTYKGTEFRSKLEANVAQLFDACAIPWAYEAEGYQLGDVWYLPDFWLPAAKQFVEVKGATEDPSLEKCIALARAVRSGVPEEQEVGRPAAVVVLSPPFIRTHCGLANEVFGFGWNGVERVDALLVRCPRCKVDFFMTREHGWTCSACDQWSERAWRCVMVAARHRRGVTKYERLEDFLG